MVNVIIGLRLKNVRHTFYGNKDAVSCKCFLSGIAAVSTPGVTRDHEFTYRALAYLISSGQGTLSTPANVFGSHCPVSEAVVLRLAVKVVMVILLAVRLVMIILLCVIRQTLIPGLSCGSFPCLSICHM